MCVGVLQPYGGNKPHLHATHPSLPRSATSTRAEQRYAQHLHEL